MQDARKKLINKFDLKSRIFLYSNKLIFYNRFSNNFFKNILYIRFVRVFIIIFFLIFIISYFFVNR